MTALQRYPYMLVQDNGVTLPHPTSARVQVGYHIQYAQADVSFMSLSSLPQPWDVITIVMGASEASAQLRFTGFYICPTYGYYPQSIKLTCWGKLGRASQQYHSGDTDMSHNLSAPNGHGATDQALVATLLADAGLCSYPTTGYPQTNIPAGIGGTGRILGTISQSAGFAADTSTSGLDFINKLDQICLGYKTWDLADGSIVRQPVTAVPGAIGTQNWTFTEGLDIVKGSNTQDITSAKNMAVVTGWTGIKNGNTWPVQIKQANASLMFGGNQWYSQVSMSSAMIEWDLDSRRIANNGQGLAADAVANWLLQEQNRWIENLTLNTPRDDMILPNQTILVNSPTRLGVDRVYYVKGTDCQITDKNNWQQTLTLTGTVPPG